MSRLQDLCVGGALLVLTAPLQAAIALAVRIDLGAPVLFTQTRLGRGGRPFTLHKFRTLPGGEVVAATRLGRWLRRLHLDELPQLCDVLRGDMALVGPRPEVPDNLEAIDAATRARLWQVRPGITGPTQLAFVAEDDVLAGLDESLAVYRRVLVPAKVQRDLQWLTRRTWWGDLGVLLRTPFVLLSPAARRRSRQLVASLLR
ncbi:MAG: sugar transferase [Planctomycetes bacterium]|nr:sugar transferase [Planctomycetota bacterium]MCB9885609.1 sugar transferase [Planctomycetota bacterium]